MRGRHYAVFQAMFTDPITPIMPVMQNGVRLVEWSFLVMSHCPPATALACACAGRWPLLKT
jgi:hypothetical protein